MGRTYKIAFGIWTGAPLSIFGLSMIGAATSTTCGALSTNPCPELEMALVLVVGAGLLVVWAIGTVPFLLVYWANHRRRRFRYRS